MYWLAQSAPDFHELDQVGLTLQAKGGDYMVAAEGLGHRHHSDAGFGWRDAARSVRRQQS